MTAVYWLGAPGVSQLEYPPGSGVLYNVGDYIPDMTEPEARSMVPLGHSFQIPTVYPYGTPAMAQPAGRTSMRIPLAARTGEPTDASEGVILNGPAPQSDWVPPEPPPPPPPPPPPGQLISGAIGQEAWLTSDTGQEQLVAVAIPTVNQPIVGPVDQGEAAEEEVVATAIATPPEPESEPEPEPEMQEQQE